MVLRKMIIILLITSNFLLSQTKKKVAVFDFYGPSVYKNYISLFSKKFFTELYNTNKFELVERENIYTILKEQGFQISGFSDQNTAVKIGMILNADYIIIGNVDIIPNQITSFTIRLINVTTGKIENVKNETCYNCSLKTILDHSLKNLAHKIAGLPTIKQQKHHSIISKNPDISSTINKNIFKKTIGIESDISRLALNGYNLSIWYGLLNRFISFKFKFFYENFKFPKFYFKNGLINLNTNNYGMLIDFIVPGNNGLFLSSGLYYGSHLFRPKNENITTKYENFKYLFGIGIIYHFYHNFYFSASFIGRAIVVGDKEISINNKIFVLDKNNLDLSICAGWHF